MILCNRYFSLKFNLKIYDTKTSGYERKQYGKQIFFVVYFLDMTGQE